jgi:hypothetical protein
MNPGTLRDSSSSGTNRARWLRPGPTWTYALAACWVVVSASACLDGPSETALYSSYILPAGADVPKLEDDLGAAAKLRANAGLGSMIVLRSAFVAGHNVQYWDFGQLTTISVKPMWVFRRRNALGTGDPQEIGHPDLIDSIPGDTPYTPLRQIFVVFVTDLYRNERVTSLRALDDAVELGIMEAPQAADYFVNCIVAPSTVQLQTSDDGTSMGPQSAYYRGKLVKQFCPGGLVAKVGAFAFKDGSFMPGNAYLVRRVDETQPLDEALFKADLDGDGDQLDTNTIYDSNVNEDSYTSVWRSLDVVVARDYKFGTARAESDLFDDTSGMLVAKDAVLQYRDNGVFLNRPIKQVLP